MNNRDRDSQGRPRNSRPRDGLGRPLPRGAETGVPRVDEDLALTPAESLVEAQRFLDDGKPFHAHEVLEGAWKLATPTERELWRGLAQLAVGLTHLYRGNARGARTLLQRGAVQITPYASDPPHEIDVTGLLSWVQATLAGPETQSVAAPRLCASRSPRLR